MLIPQHFLTFSRLICLGLSMTILASAAEDKPKVSSQLQFTNGDIISGNIQGYEDKKISLTSDQLEKPALLHAHNLLNINLLNATKSDVNPSKKKQDHEARITLKPRLSSTEGDTLYGELKAITDDIITLDTPYAGLLPIKRSLVSNMEIASLASIYCPPFADSDWIKLGDKDAWVIEHDNFTGGHKNGQITRDFKLPNTCVLSFDFDWKRNLDLRLHLFSNSVQNENPDQCYSLTVRNNYAYMRKNGAGANNAMAGSKPIANTLHEQNSARIDIFMDKSKGIFHLYIDGEEACVFTDPQPANEKLGGGIHLISDSNAASRIRNLTVNTWSGIIPNVDDEKSFTAQHGAGQRILLRNGDAILGKIGTIENNILTVQTKHAKIPVPVSAMRTLLLKDTERDSPKMASNDVRAHFRQGGWVILDLQAIKDGKLIGYHQGFGTKEFDLSAFSHIEFNIYDDKINQLRVDQDW